MKWFFVLAIGVGTFLYARFRTHTLQSFTPAVTSRLDVSLSQDDTHAAITTTLRRLGLEVEHRSGANLLVRTPPSFTDWGWRHSITTAQAAGGCIVRVGSHTCGPIVYEIHMDPDQAHRGLVAALERQFDAALKSAP